MALHSEFNRKNSSLAFVGRPPQEVSHSTRQGSTDSLAGLPATSAQDGTSSSLTSWRLSFLLHPPGASIVAPLSICFRLRSLFYAASSLTSATVLLSWTSPFLTAHNWQLTTRASRKTSTSSTWPQACRVPGAPDHFGCRGEFRGCHLSFLCQCAFAHPLLCPSPSCRAEECNGNVARPSAVDGSTSRRVRSTLFV